MKPLRVEAPFLRLCSQHPDAALFRDTVSLLSPQSREMVVRTWLTEGIPFAFRECPAIYESARTWLASRLQVCPKEITLVGSARLGFSLAPPHYGRAFGSQSDLDLSVVSESLFNELSKAFTQWREDYARGVVGPRSSREAEFWVANVRFGLDNLSRGFMDANKVPTLDRYRVAQRLNQAMWQLKKKLELTDGAPRPRKVSVRVYNSWRDLVLRVSFNLRIALSER